MVKKIFIILVLIAGLNSFAASELEVAKRDSNWKMEAIDASQDTAPSDLKYFKFFDVLPEEITYKIFENMDLSGIGDKKLHVGYGIADPQGKDCITFKSEDTGQANDMKVCMPWWRAEREYLVKPGPLNTTPDVLELLRKPRPPIMINVCEQKAPAKTYAGGKVSCTSYYDKNAGGDCWLNPMSSKCFVNNCGKSIEDNCEYLDSFSGMTDTLVTAVDNDANIPIQAETKIDLTTHSYRCEAGTITEGECIDSKDVLMFPYECKLDNPETIEDDGEYTYCDEEKPLYDTGGKITGFGGECANGEQIECKVNRFTNSTAKCVDPVFQTNIEYKNFDFEDTRTFVEKSADVLSGELDIYSADENCLRSNTVEDAREQQLYVKIKGIGSLDDDIFVLKHKESGAHAKIYCNEQHNGNAGNKLNYNGDILSCIGNNGSYSFDETVNIDVTDIVTVQQNSENENATGEPFVLGRTHFGSTKVTIDDVEVAPDTFPTQYPYYPANQPWLKIWDNTTGNLSILFPFASAYNIYFYNQNDELLATRELNTDDFKAIPEQGNLNLFLGNTMKLAPGIEDDSYDENGNSVTLNANRRDLFVEWGGGVYGGRSSVTGIASSSPNDDYVKEHSVYKIIVQDLLTDVITPIKLVYPLPYPNRVFVSKLKVYEHKKYRCYDDFAPFASPTSNAVEKFVCSDNEIWKDFNNGTRGNIDGLQQWENNELCEQNCFEQNVCSAKISNGKNGFTCLAKGGSDIGGDLEGNLFTDKDLCNSECKEFKSCTPYIQNDCEIVEESYDDQITDITGKTLYKQKNNTYRCKETTEEQIGCAKYVYTVAEGNIDYNINAIGYETKDYSDMFEDELARINMLDVGSQHIWSGWKGKCVIGMKMDSSYLSDPMTIASYAMSAYSSYTQINGTSLWDQASTGTFGTTISGAAKTANETAVAVSDAASNAYDSTVGVAFSSAKSAAKSAWTAFSDSAGKLGSEASKQAAVEASKQAAIEASKQAAIEASKQAAEKAAFELLDDATKEAVTKKLTEEAAIKATEETAKKVATGFLPKIFSKVIIEEGVIWEAVTVQKLILLGVNIAMDILAPTEDEFKLAQKLLKPYENDGDVGVQAYSSCMSSIGLSFPALIGYSAGVPGGTSDEIAEPWNHPLRVTSDQLESLVQSMGQKVVELSFNYNSEDNILINLMALNQSAYIKAGQVICAGRKVSQSMDFINIKKGRESTLGGTNVAAMATGVAISVISAFNPALGFAAKIAMDLYTNMLVKIDTCHDQEDAETRGIMEYKTFRALDAELCTLTKTYCDKKSALFSPKKKCVRDGYDYCCFDKATTKIFNEGLKEQLDQNWDTCVGIEINDLKDVGFSACKPGQIPKIDKCIATGKFDEYKNTLFRQSARGLNVDDLASQITKTMKQ